MRNPGVQLYEGSDGVGNDGNDAFATIGIATANVKLERVIEKLHSTNVQDPKAT